ncbi:MAG: 4Fe-4S dicluster domain-containing protein, partial [Patescibacteria group bacterium]|nr:4Fe-4S dicluster domain-containing protein [Patescibacteria group bacterium]
IKHKKIKQLGNSSPKDKKEAKAMNELFKKLDNHKIWKELGEICIACGKCSIVCPTCFCFDFDDEISPTKSCRNRIWGSCFYQDFTKIAGGYVFKDKVADRIKFWYMHKFLRIPKEYGMLGCVKCGRCADVCPVEIDIKANIKRLKKVSGSVE